MDIGKDTVKIPTSKGALAKIIGALLALKLSMEGLKNALSETKKEATICVCVPVDEVINGNPKCICVQKTKESV